MKFCVVLFVVILDIFQGVCANRLTLYDTYSKELPRPYILGEGQYYCMRTDVREANWKLLVETAEGMQTCEERQNSTVFIIDATQMSFEWKNATRKNVGDKSYFQAWVISETTTEKDTLSFVFDLLPSKPRFNSVKFKYDGLDEEFYFVNPTVDIQLTIFNNREIYGIGIPKNGSSVLQYMYPIDFININDSICSVVDTWELDEKMCFVSCNKYGVSLSSDTLLPNNYIDKSILDAIEDYIASITAIRTPIVSDVHPILKGRKLNVTDDVLSVFVYDIMGREILARPQVKHSENFDLPQGMFIIKEKLVNKKEIIKKVIL